MAPAAAQCHWKNVMRLANDVRGGVRSSVWKYRQGSFAVSQFRFAVFARTKRSCQRSYNGRVGDGRKRAGDRLMLSLSCLLG